MRAVRPAEPNENHYSAFVVGQRADSHGISIVSGHRENCDITKRARIEFLGGSRKVRLSPVGQELLLGVDLSVAATNRVIYQEFP